MFVKPGLICFSHHPFLWAELPQSARGVARLSVPDPDRGDMLPLDGREVQQSVYWTRRINCGDAELADPPQPAVVSEPAVENTSRS